jgi:hypothetical protein
MQKWRHLCARRLESTRSILLLAVAVAADRRKQIEGAIAALGSLRSAVASEQSRILDEVVALLASLDGELASLSAKLRWHASAPFRSKKDEAPEGQLAFELLRMLTGRLGQEPAADGGKPSEGDAPPSDGDKPSDQNAPGGRGSRPHRKRRGRGLRRKIEEVKVAVIRVNYFCRLATTILAGSMGGQLGWSWGGLGSPEL